MLENLVKCSITNCAPCVLQFSLPIFAYLPHCAQCLVVAAVVVAVVAFQVAVAFVVAVVVGFGHITRMH